MSKFQVISIIISIIVLLSNIIIFLLNMKISLNNTNTNLEAFYFREIFVKYLIKEIPLSNRYVHFKNNKLCDINYLIDTLNNMKTDSVYFHYVKEEFYNDLKKQCQDLEDYLVKYSNYESPYEVQTQILNTISEKIKLIYKTISRNYRKF